MAAPVASKTWAHINSSVPIGAGPAPMPVTPSGGYGPECRQLLYDIKSAMVASPGAWTVLKTCGWNGSNFVVNDSGDNWADSSWVGHNQGTDYGWIVLRNNSISAAGQGFQICIALYAYNAPFHMQVAVSFSAGFTGGTTSARPTATDEASWNFINWTGNSNNSRGASIFKTSDGECVRVYTSFAAALSLCFGWEKPKAGFNPSWAKSYIYNVGKNPVYANMTTANFGYTEIPGISGFAEFRCTCEAYGGGPIPNWSRFDNADFDGKWISCPAGLAHVDGPAPYAHLGYYSDLWFISDNLATGDYFPGGGSRDFVILGNVLQPNDGSIIIID